MAKVTQPVRGRVIVQAQPFCSAPVDSATLWEHARWQEGVPLGRAARDTAVEAQQWLLCGMCSRNPGLSRDQVPGRPGDGRLRREQVVVGVGARLWELDITWLKGWSPQTQCLHPTHLQGGKRREGSRGPEACLALLSG